jgi:large subunit ribosomal protein L25
MDRIELSVRKRHEKGKSPTRELRRNKQMPAVFYGPAQEPVMLAVKTSDLQGIVKKGSGENIILGLRIESDTGIENKTVMLKELQVDPIKDTFIHADFYEISMDKEITVELPLRFVKTPVGVAEGGIFQQVRRELTVSCLPDKLTEFIEVDVSGLGIGDSLHIEDITLPAGMVTSQEGHLAVAVVTAPSVEEEIVEEEEVMGEPVEGEPEETVTEDGSG